MKILVTGGAGYIGSHTVLCLLENNIEVVVLDNLVNSNVESLHRVEKLTGKTLTFIQGDVRDQAAIEHVLSEHEITAVIHFAALKAVGESSKAPLDYYQNNVDGTLTLLAAMANMVLATLFLVHRRPYMVEKTMYLMLKQCR